MWMSVWEKEKDRLCISANGKKTRNPFVETNMRSAKCRKSTICNNQRSLLTRTLFQTMRTRFASMTNWTWATISEKILKQKKSFSVVTRHDDVLSAFLDVKVSSSSVLSNASQVGTLETIYCDPMRLLFSRFTKSVESTKILGKKKRDGQLFREKRKRLFSNIKIL